jgi:hypothetical protein
MIGNYPNSNTPNSMKKIIILLVFLPLFVFSQTDTTLNKLPYTEGKVVYEKVISINGVTKDVIYTTSKKWIVDSFLSSNTVKQISVIQTEDKDFGQIIGKGYKPIFMEENPKPEQTMFGSLLNFYFFVQIDCKDEKFRIRFYDLKRDLIFGNQVQPIEEYDTIMTNHKNPKRREEWEIIKLRINQYFSGLPEVLRNKIIQSSKDTF